MTFWRRNKSIPLLGIFLVLGIMVAWNHWPLGRAPVPAPPEQVATVNGMAITRAMIERELKVSRLNVASPLPSLTGEDLERARTEALNQLITRQLILQAARRQNFKLDPATIEAKTALLFGDANDPALQEALTRAGANWSDLLWWIGEMVTVESFTIEVVMAGAAPEARQQVYNEWLNARQAEAQIAVYAENTGRAAQLLVGEPAPNFTLSGLDGQPVSLSDYTGKVVLVNFWATWCPSCITEMPDYEQVYQKYAPELVVVGVNLQEDSGQVQPYVEGLGLTFPVLLDRKGDITTRQYQLTGMPGSFIIDRQGKIFYRHIGPMSEELLEAKLKALGL